MKKVFLFIATLFLISCSTMKPAVSYHYFPGNDQSENVGKITQILEVHGYSIIMTDGMIQPVYVWGKLPKDMGGPRALDAYIWKEYNRNGEVHKSHFVFNHKRYEITPSERL